MALRHCQTALEVGGGEGEGELAIRIANIFVVLIMNEKRNECSESCRQANFFTAEFQYSISYSTLFFAQLYQYW